MKKRFKRQIAHYWFLIVTLKIAKNNKKNLKKRKKSTKYLIIFLFQLVKKIEKQAGAELCQAQTSLS